MSDEQMTKQLNLKQTLIKAEITDKHYNLEQFLKYCSEKKPNGNNLDQWTLLQINELVVSFIKIEKLREQQKNELLNKDSKDEFKVKDKGSNIIKSGVIMSNLENIPILINNEYVVRNIIICKTLEPSELTGKTITIKVNNPLINETGIFELNYITYEVITEEMKWRVRRRNTDFEWLRGILCKLFPCSYIPPLPKKKKGKGEDYIYKRMTIIEHFISAIAQNESFKASEAIVLFLSIKDRQQFEAFMKELNLVQLSTVLQEQKTLSGKIIIKDRCDNNEEEDKYYCNSHNFFEMQYKLFKRLKTNLQKYNNSINEASIFLEEASKDFKELYLINEKVMMKEEITRSYHELSLFCNDWKKIHSKQNSLIELHLTDFFKYVKMEEMGFMELLANREDINQKYKAEEIKLITKKEMLWNSKDISKWEIVNENNTTNQSLLNNKDLAFNKMCTKKTEIVEGYYNQLAYANMTFIEELNHHIYNLKVRYETNIQEFTTNLYPTLTDSITVWTGLNNFMNS